MSDIGWLKIPGRIPETVNPTIGCEEVTQAGVTEVSNGTSTWGELNAQKASFCSAIVAVATVSGILAPSEGIARMKGWRVSDQYGIQLSDLKVLKSPIAAKGKIAPILWPVPETAIETMRQEGAI